MISVRIPDPVLWALTHSYTRPQPELYAEIVLWCAENEFPVPNVIIRHTSGATAEFFDERQALAFKMRWC